VFLLVVLLAAAADAAALPTPLDIAQACCRRTEHCAFIYRGSGGRAFLQRALNFLDLPEVADARADWPPAMASVAVVASANALPVCANTSWTGAWSLNEKLFVNALVRFGLDATPNLGCEVCTMPVHDPGTNQRWCRPRPNVVCDTSNDGTFWSMTTPVWLMYIFISVATAFAMASTVFAVARHGTAEKVVRDAVSKMGMELLAR